MTDRPPRVWVTRGFLGMPIIAACEECGEIWQHSPGPDGESLAVFEARHNHKREEAP